MVHENYMMEIIIYSTIVYNSKIFSVKIIKWKCGNCPMAKFNPLFIKFFGCYEDMNRNNNNCMKWLKSKCTKNKDWEYFASEIK